MEAPERKLPRAVSSGPPLWREGEQQGQREVSSGVELGGAALGVRAGKDPPGRCKLDAFAEFKNRVIGDGDLP